MCMGLEFCRCAYHGDGSYIKKCKIPPGSGDILMEPMSTFHVGYIAQNNSSLLCQVINVKRPHKLLRMV